MEDFLKKLKTEVLVCDGAMGTMLQENGLSQGECPEMWNITHKKVVQSIHREYLDAGCNILITNTFGGNLFKLRKMGLEDNVHEANIAGAHLAKDVAGDKAYVLGDIGPTGEFMEPLGELKYEDFYNVFKEQALALRSGGVDGIIIETMSALEEIRAAVLAVKENTDLPVVAAMTFQITDSGFRTMMGVDVKKAVTEIKDMGCDVIGSNCGCGIREMVRVIKEMRRCGGTDGYLIAEPNAGMPRLVDGKTVFDESPQDMAAFVPELLKEGVKIIGGCCGTTPSHIREIVRAVTG